MFFGGYPITQLAIYFIHYPPGNILGLRHFKQKMKWLESLLLLALLLGSLGGAATSGPGAALKKRGHGFGSNSRIIVVINVQRGGPSTGLPTKTEQSTCYRLCIVEMEKRHYQYLHLRLQVIVSLLHMRLVE